MKTSTITKLAALLCGLTFLPLTAGAQTVSSGTITVSEAWSPNYLWFSGGHITIDGGAINTGTYFQDAGATLTINLDNRGGAYVNAVAAILGGTLQLIQDNGADALKASAAGTLTHTLFHTNGSAVYGNFDQIILPNFLSGTTATVGDDYVYFQQLAWNSGTGGGGSFTLSGSQTFELDVSLGNQTPVSGTAGSWDGQSLRKDGDGTLIVSGSQAYTGTTVVSGGTLQVTGSGQLNSTAQVSVSGGVFRYDSDTALDREVEVNGGKFSYNSAQNFSGTLTFTSGTLGGTNLRGIKLLFTNSNVTLAPGNSIGTLYADDVTFSRLGVLEVEIGGASLNDKLVTDTLTLSDGGFTINLVNLGFGNFDANQNYSWEFLAYGTLNGSVDSGAFTFNTDGFTGMNASQLTISAVDGKLVLSYSAVPEPSAWALLLTALAAMALGRRRIL